MKRNKHFIVILGMVLLATGSCKKYLGVKSNKSLVVLKTLDDLQAVLNDYIVLNKKTPGFGETSSGDYFITLNEFNSMNLLDKGAYIWNMTEYHHPNDWSYAYRALYSVNYCLDKIKGIKRTDKNKKKWNNIKGSALFYRSFWFLNLIWNFGKAYDPQESETDLGIVLRLSSDFTIPSKRASVKESYGRILKDCKTAVELLPDFPQKLTQPSLSAAYALLARTYLSMRVYDSAYKYSKLALNMKDNLLNFNNSTEVDTNSNTPFQPLNKEILFYSIQSLSYHSKNPNVAMIDTTLYSSYRENDLRKIVYFRPNGKYYSLKTTYNANDRYRFFSGLATDEMVLIKAECEARRNNISKALQTLSILLKNRYRTGALVLPESLNKQETIDLILQERRKELLFRGIRWSDIKRLNIEGRNIILTRKLGNKEFKLRPNSNYYALPLPADVIKLTGMPQNSR